jgi:hypothetical protein
MPDLPIGETEGRWLEPGKLAYVRVPSFFGPAFEKKAIDASQPTVVLGASVEF